jgi:protein-tyrosine-phosphatase
VDSAGTSAANGAPASRNALAVAAENGLDLSVHRSRLLTPEQLQWADVVLGMSPAHVARAAELEAGARVSLLTDFLEGPGSGSAVRDPFGGDMGEYRDTYRQIHAAVTAVMDRLERVLAP